MMVTKILPVEVSVINRNNELILALKKVVGDNINYVIYTINNDKVVGQSFSENVFFDTYATDSRMTLYKALLLMEKDLYNFYGEQGVSSLLTYINYLKRNSGAYSKKYGAMKEFRISSNTRNMVVDVIDKYNKFYQNVNSKYDLPRVCYDESLEYASDEFQFLNDEKLVDSNLESLNDNKKVNDIKSENKEFLIDDISRIRKYNEAI